jgi:signal peptidase I
MLKKIKKKLKWLDPFTYVDEFLLPIINPSKNELVSNIVYLISAFIFAFIAYSLLGFLFNSVSPIVVIVSGSMQPALHRGDIMFVLGVNPEEINAPEIELPLNTLKGVSYSEFARTGFEKNNSLIKSKQIEFNSNEILELNKEGDIIVYNSIYSQKPVIHRIVAKLKVQDGYYYLTKGDNDETNYFIDQECGKIINGMPSLPCIELFPVQHSQLNGKAVFSIPLIGYIKLILIDDLMLLLQGCPGNEWFEMTPICNLIN